MANYNVGNIEIGVISSTKGALNSIDKVITKLQEFNKIDKSLQNTFSSINKLSNGFNKISKLNMGQLATQINGISEQTLNLVNSLATLNSTSGFQETTKSLNLLSNALRKFERLKDIDMRKLYGTFSSLTRIIEPFLAKLKESEASLVAMSNVLNNLKAKTITKATNEIDKANNSTTKLNNNVSLLRGNFNKLFNLGQIYLLYNYSKRIIYGLVRIVGYASDYIEILNKFQVSFGNLYEENLKSVNQLAEAFGFSTNTLMNYTATFNNMLKGLKGLSDETSATISQTLTKMAIDYSSLFNVSIDRAMNAFQSAISGNIRTLRAISGFDVSEITIFSIYQELGGTKSMRQLNQLEKRLLRIIAIQRQMEATGALGDYGRTIETVSNQVKILKENLIEVGKWIGMNLLVYIKPVIQYANAILMTIKEIMKALARTKEQTDNINYAEEFASFGKSVSETENEVEELNEAINSLLGFDTLNILGDSSNGLIGNLDGLSVEGIITDALKEYNMNLDKVNYKAKDISKNLLEWLGFYQRLNPETEEMEWHIREGYTNLDKIKDVGKTILGIFVTSKISRGILKIGTSLKSVLGPLKTFFGKSGLKGGAKGGAIGLLITGAIVGFRELYNNNEKFRKSIDTTLSRLKKNLSTIWIFLKDKVFPVLKPILNFIWEAVKGTGALLVDFILKTLDRIVSLLAGDFSGAWNSILEMFETWGDYIARMFGVETWNKMMNNIKNAVSNAGKWIMDKVLMPIKNWFANLFDWIKEKLNDLKSLFNDIKNNSFNLKFPGIKPPKFFAKGGVITKPTNAIVGEYANARSNPEIITPENLMRKIFVESMLPIAQAIINGNQSVVGAIDDLANRPIELDGRRLSEGLYGYLNKVAIRKNGKPLGAK